MSELKSYHVWDAGTRWFHWINVLCVIGLAGVGLVILNATALEISNAGKITLKTIHTWIGYVFAVNLLWRLIWSRLGNRHARLSAALPGGRGYLRSLREYLSATISGTPRQYLGHNPLARLAIAALFLAILSQALTGLVLAGTDLFYPPFGYWIAEWVAAPGVPPATLVPYAPELYDAAAYEAMRAVRKPIVSIHEYGFYVLLALVVLHVAAVVVTEVREGGSIVSAMFTGRKVLSAHPADEDASG